MKALRASVNFDKDLCRMKALGRDRRRLSTTENGHYLIPIFELPPGGHVTPSDHQGPHNRCNARVAGPTITIYAATGQLESSGVHEGEQHVNEESIESDDSLGQPAISDAQSPQSGEGFLDLRAPLTEPRRPEEVDFHKIKDFWTHSDDLPERIRYMVDHCRAEPAFVRRHEEPRGTRFFPGGGDKKPGGPREGDRVSDLRLTCTGDGRFVWDRASAKSASRTWKPDTRKWTGFTVFSPAPGSPKAGSWAWEPAPTHYPSMRELGKLVTEAHKGLYQVRPADLDEARVKVLARRDRRLLINESKKGAKCWWSLPTELGGGEHSCALLAADGQSPPVFSRKKYRIAPGVPP